MTTNSGAVGSRTPRIAALTGLALAAVSSGCFTLTTALANAATATSTPTPAVVPAVVPSIGQNGPIAYSTHAGGFNTPLVWMNVDPDGNGRYEVPVGDPNAYNGVGAGVIDQGTSFDRGASYPVFSPDGAKVVFSTSTVGCQFLADADGTNALALGGQTCDNALVPDHTTPFIATPVSGKPVWSADSKSVYFSHNGTISALTEDGSSLTTLAVQVPADYQLVSASPSGALAFIVSPPFSASQVYVLDPGASAPHLVTSGSAAAFSPDGTRLIVLDSAPGAAGQQLFLVDPVGGTRTLLTSPATDHVDSQFSWSPDGRQVAYATNDSGSGMTLWTRPTTPGGTPTTVTRSATTLQVTSWHNGPITPPRAADRIGSTDRIATALAVSKWNYGTFGKLGNGRSASTAVLSRSDQFADALSGSALAAEKNGPLLLTPTSGLDSRVGAELTRILQPGSEVLVLGGPNALSPTVDDQIRALGFFPGRLEGPDRYTTSVFIASAVGLHAHTVMVATGLDFPDALAAGAAAAQDPAGGVVLLSAGGVMPDIVKEYLTGNGVSPQQGYQIYAVGGPGKTALNTAFPQWSSSIKVLSGSDRYGTAAVVAGSPLFALNRTVPRIGLATGSTWPDALSGGSLIATQHGPLLLTAPGTDQLPPAEKTVVQALAPHLTGIVAFGGPNAVGIDVELNTATSALGANRFFTYSNRIGQALFY